MKFEYIHHPQNSYLMGATTIDHARDLFRVVASIYSACFDDDDGGAAAIPSLSLTNDEDVKKFVKCKSLAKIEAMSDYMKEFYGWIQTAHSKT